MVFKRKKAKTKAVEPPVEDIEIEDEDEDSDEVEEDEDDDEEEEEQPIKKGKEKMLVIPRAVSIPEMFNVLSDKFNVISDKLDYLISKK